MNTIKVTKEIKSQMFKFAHYLRKNSNFEFKQALSLVWSYVTKKEKQFKIAYVKVEKMFIKTTVALVTVGLPYNKGIKERFNIEPTGGTGLAGWAVYNSIGIMQHRNNGTNYLTCFFDTVLEQTYTDLNGNTISPNHPDILNVKSKRSNSFDPGYRTIKYENITSLMQATNKVAKGIVRVGVTI